MSTKAVKQPMIIEHGGHRYERFQKLRKLPFGISEGPFYSRPGVNAKDLAFTPDLDYLQGSADKPAFMHCIQQRERPATPRPTA